MTNLDSILKSRDVTLPTKVRLVKGVVFPVVMYGCESWTIKKAEYQRIDDFELWCWKRFLRVPWTARIPAFEKCTPRPHDLMAQLQLIRLGAAGRPDQTGIWN